MTKFCIVCKKQYVPGDCRSTFHCFPKNNEQRQKWMTVLNIFKYPVNARVCSDHFDSNSYHLHKDNSNHLKKLLSTAVPKLEREAPGDLKNRQTCTNLLQISKETKTANLKNKKVEFVLNVCKAVTLKRKNDCDADVIDLSESKKFCADETGCHAAANNNIITNIKSQNKNEQCCVAVSDNNLKGKCTTLDSQVHEREKLCFVNNAINIPLLDNHCISDHDYCSNTKENKNNNSKRKISTSEVDEILNPNKKLRWKDGQNTIYFTKQNFTSDEAWNNFIKFTIRKKQQILNLQTKVRRKNKIINSLKDVIKVLKETKGASSSRLSTG
ncbi:PREDICTED: uncharacterized protein LOC107073428 isoform X2 [Polistes dominula]|nr:PREDICTED: uncharacterized protein LOC107073428 isoform X2 [Polistes dominula]